VDLTIAHATRPCAGETVNGDAIIVRRDASATLIAIVDALGHGPEAAEVAARACSHIVEVSLASKPSAIIERLHEGLTGTRGAAALVCIVRGAMLHVSGIGNVELRSLSGSVSIPLVPGIVGQRIRRITEQSSPLRLGERLVLFSDGIASRVNVGEHREQSADACCDAILQRHGRPHDDASVVVVDVGDYR
jgi:negative regulator of sigma-B (phosphoserine phosphatase)